MGMIHSPNVVNTGLVLSFDAVNPRSFRGEPTTNLLASPTINAYPTTGNGWGTYNTNQYNNNTYFSIGAISSVTSNIVTTSGAHPLRSYDVVTPQTTGGGVTAGVNYLVKKISSTQFSLHEYNSSENGSQGYINSSTGTFKVYDSYANDTRISVNSTNFPTMWWGPPHLPNSGLVKELITRGFTHPDTQAVTDCIRLHYIRTDDVKDGMAYNVNATVTANQSVTVTFYTRPTSTAGEGKSINYSVYTYGSSSPTYSGMNFTLGPPGVWQRQTYTFTPANENMISYWFANTGGVYSWEWSNMQVEQKAYATAFVAGTRGTTNATGGGWVDLSGNGRHGELVNGPTYTSDNGGSIVFDGSNDYVDITSDLGTMSTYTIMFWARRDAENRMPIAGRTSTAFYWYGDNSWYYTHGGVAAEYYYSKPTSIPINTWGHYCVVYNGSNVSIYRQGIFQGSQNTTGTANWSQGLRIGYWSSGGSYAWQGRIANVLMYNTALTATEVQQNFEVTRAKFGV